MPSFSELPRAPPRPDESEVQRCIPQTFSFDEVSSATVTTHLYLGQPLGSPGLCNIGCEIINRGVLPTPEGLSRREFQWCRIDRNSCGSREENHLRRKLFSGRSSFSLRSLESPPFHWGMAENAAQPTRKHRQMLRVLVRRCEKAGYHPEPPFQGSQVEWKANCTYEIGSMDRTEWKWHWPSEDIRRRGSPPLPLPRCGLCNFTISSVRRNW